nr:hypothetical protein CFP56_49418 [Quercus suber]
MEAAEARSGGFRGGVEWAGGQWQLDQRSVVAARSASALEIGAVGLGCLWISDDGGWAKIFKCVMFVRSGLVISGGQIGDRWWLPNRLVHWRLKRWVLGVCGLMMME